MKVLLDTHTLIWYAEGASQLSLKARTELENIYNTKFVSIVSMWEIAIKANSNKIEFKQTFRACLKLAQVILAKIIETKVN